MGSGPSKHRDHKHFGFPPELIEELEQYLTFSDRLNCRLVCKAWNDRLRDTLSPYVAYKVQGNWKVLESTTAGSWRHFTFFGSPDLGDSQLWEVDHWRITTLKFFDCDIVKLFGKVVSNNRTEPICPNLINLAICNCDDYFRDSNLPIQHILQLKNLESLKLSSNRRYLTDKIVSDILLETERLQSLDLSDTNIGFNSAVYNRFYPEVKKSPQRIYPSGDVFTFEFLHQGFLSTSKAAKMIELIVDNTNFDGRALLSISDPAKYRWTNISVKNCKVDGDSIVTFLNQQRSISKLGFGIVQHSSRNEGIGRALYNLESMVELSLRCVDLNCLPLIQNSLQKVKVLEIVADKITASFSELHLPRLCVLRLKDNCYGCWRAEESTPSSSSSISVLSSTLERLSNLTELDLSLCCRIMTDEILQKIIGCIKGLQHLNLSNCRYITDLGNKLRLKKVFIGLDYCSFQPYLFYKDNNFTGMAGKFLSRPVKNVEILQSNGSLINLQQYYDNWKSSDNNAKIRRPLSDLKGLKTLVLKNCSTLSDATFENALCFQHVEKLDLWGTEVTASQLPTIVKNCGSKLKISVPISVMAPGILPPAINVHPFLQTYLRHK